MADHPILVAHFAPLLLPLARNRSLAEIRYRDVLITADPAFGMPDRRDLRAMLLCIDAGLRGNRLTPRYPVDLDSLHRVGSLRLAVEQKRPPTVLAAGPDDGSFTDIICIASQLTDTDIELSAEWAAFCGAALVNELPWEKLTKLSPGALSIAVTLATTDQNEFDPTALGFRAGKGPRGEYTLTRRIKGWLGELVTAGLSDLGTLEGNCQRGWVITGQPDNVRACSGNRVGEQRPNMSRRGKRPQTSVYDFFSSFLKQVPITGRSDIPEDLLLGQVHDLDEIRDSLAAESKGPNAEYIARIGAWFAGHRAHAVRGLALRHEFAVSLGRAEADRTPVNELPTVVEDTTNGDELSGAEIEDLLWSSEFDDAEHVASMQTRHAELDFGDVYTPTEIIVNSTWRAPGDEEDTAFFSAIPAGDFDDNDEHPTDRLVGLVARMMLKLQQFDEAGPETTNPRLRELWEQSGAMMRILATLREQVPQTSSQPNQTLSLVTSSPTQKLAPIVPIRPPAEESTAASGDRADEIGGVLDDIDAFTRAQVVELADRIPDAMAFRDAFLLGVQDLVHDTVGSICMDAPTATTLSAVPMPISDEPKAAPLSLVADSDSSEQASARSTAMVLPIRISFDPADYISPRIERSEPAVPAAMPAAVPASPPPSVERSSMRPWLTRAIPAAGAAVAIAAAFVLFVGPGGDPPTARAGIPDLPLDDKILDVCMLETTPVIPPIFAMPPGSPNSTSAASRLNLSTPAAEAASTSEDAQKTKRDSMAAPKRTRMRAVPRSDRVSKVQTSTVEVKTGQGVRLIQPGHAPVTVTTSESTTAKATYQVEMKPGIAVETVHQSGLIITFSQPTIGAKQ